MFISSPAFYRSLGMLLRGGMPVVTSLQMVSDLLESSLRGQLNAGLASIAKAMRSPAPMEQYGLTTPIASRICAWASAPVAWAR